MNVTDELFLIQDKDFAAFQARILPNTDPGSIIGTRTPALRSLAKKLKGTPGAEEFLTALPHRYFDENQLHAFILSEEKSFEKCAAGVEEFLPYVDNWATCDQLSPKVFKKHTDELLPYIEKWMASDETYTVRFGIGMLMQHYLGENFDPAYPEAVAKVRSDEYYVNMMRAWYFATALAKQYESTIPYITERRLDVWTHNKTIRKSIESYRISAERKEFLRSLAIK